MFDQKEYNKQWRLRNPERLKQYEIKYKDRRKIRRHQRRINNPEETKFNDRRQYIKKTQWIRDYKLSKGCSVCGYNKCADALIFHHTEDKKFDIGTGKTRRSSEEVRREIDKCKILCANCHAELHEKENGEK